MWVDSDEEECAYLYEVSRKRGTMYGMLLESIQHYIQEIHGEDTWSAILEHAHIKNMVFTTHKRYSDDIMTTLAASAAAVLGDKNKDEMMSFFGQCFVEYFTHYGYDMIMRTSGRHYRDFLNGIDNLHETMRFSYPKMLSPSFYMEHEDRKGCTLHYRSKRVGFKCYVIGQLQQCGKKFYGVEVEVRVISETVTEQGCHVVFRLDFNNLGYTPAKGAHTYPGLAEYSHISCTTFFKVFPFSLVFNTNMVITHAGDTLKALFGTKTLVGENIEDRFTLRRPQMEFTWQNVMCLQKVVFELESIGMVRRQDCSHRVPCECGQIEATRTLLLKGQMRHIPQLKGMAFLCAPLLSNLEEMQSIGLYIHDLNMYDSSRDMVMAGWQHASRLEYSIEKQIEKSKLIAENLRKLDEWRKRSEDLLYSMIPRQIAVRLKNGEDPINTCEIFDQVTILFSYLIHFNDMCANIAAMNLVECINTVFTVFDDVVDRHNVFKVETLGDAVYMVAGGVPDRQANHAQCVAQVALDLINRVSQISLPPGIIKEMLEIKVGMHTGSVVAGVVGKRMPQYCLFGDTVNTASRMQTYSEPGRIHISEPCQQCLKGTEFVTLFRGRVNIKGKGQMNTYWLAGTKSEPNIRQVCKEIKQEQTRNLFLQQLPNSESFDFRRARKTSELHISFMFDEAIKRERESQAAGLHIVPTSPEIGPPPPSRRSSTGSRHSSVSSSVSHSIAEGSEDDFISFSAKPADSSDLSDSQESTSMSAGLLNIGYRENKRKRSSGSGGDGDSPPGLLNHRHPPSLPPLHSPDHHSWQAMQSILHENLVSSSAPSPGAGFISPGTPSISAESSSSSLSSCPFAAAFANTGFNHKPSSVSSRFPRTVSSIEECSVSDRSFTTIVKNSDTESDTDESIFKPIPKRQQLLKPVDPPLVKQLTKSSTARNGDSSATLNDSSVTTVNGPLPTNHVTIPDISIHTVESDPALERLPELVKDSSIEPRNHTTQASTTQLCTTDDKIESSGNSSLESLSSSNASDADVFSISSQASPNLTRKMSSFSGTGDVGTLVMSTLSQLDLLHNNHEHKNSGKKHSTTKDGGKLSALLCLPDLFRRLHHSRKSKHYSEPSAPRNSILQQPPASPTLQVDLNNHVARRRNSLSDLENVTVLIHDEDDNSVAVDGVDDEAKDAANDSHFLSVFSSCDRGSPQQLTPSLRHTDSTTLRTEPNGCSAPSLPVPSFPPERRLSSSSCRASPLDIPTPPLTETAHAHLSGSPPSVPYHKYRLFRSNSIAVQAFPCLSPPSDGGSGQLIRCGSASANLESLQVENGGIYGSLD